MHEFQLHYTKPLWDKFFGLFGTNAESVFGHYTAENAVPWYTVMFVLAALFTLLVIFLLKPRKLSVDEPGYGQLTLETGVLAIRDLLVDNVGPHGMKYLPVIGTFGFLILISNLMGLVPGLMSPTASTSVTFALGISSFVYYNAIGIKENGLVGHLRHFAGPIIMLARLMFPIELISNFVRPDVARHPPVRQPLRRRADSRHHLESRAVDEVGAAGLNHAAQPLRRLHADLHLRAAVDPLHQRGLAPPRRARGRRDTTTRRARHRRS